MSRPEEGCAGIREALAETRYVPRRVRLLAVQAEIAQRAMPKRGIT